jgi:MFS superfamily sulfate permease-like transporter
MKILILVIRGVKGSEFFKLRTEIVESGSRVTLKARGSLIFTNLFSLTDKIKKYPPEKEIAIDFREVHYIDHTSMAALADIEHALAAENRKIVFESIQHLKPYSAHPAAARQG